MKYPYILLLFAFLTLNTNVFAQPAAGSWAPPFTLTDIDGNEHRLHDHLAAGKAVIIDLAATWCAPCWEAHQTGVLDQIWEEYGPDGTDEVMVFFLESDPGTSIEQLTGMEWPTMGNWVDGTPYPILDPEDYLVPFAYNLNFYPTVVMICPDMRVKVPSLWTNLNNWTVDNIVNQLMTCEDTTPLENDVAIHSYDYFGASCYSGSLDYKIFNSGTETLTNATINLKRDDELLATYEWSGSLEFGDEVALSFEDIALKEGENLFTIQWQGEDEDADNNEITLPFVKAGISKMKLTLYAQMDEDVEDDNTRWYIENENGVIVAESEPAINGNFVQTDIELDAEGCYRFVALDDEGNGLGTSGFYLLTDSDDNVIFEGENFGDEASILFLAQSSVNTQHLSPAEIGFSVTPNPVTDVARVQFNLADVADVIIDCYTLTGQHIDQIYNGAVNKGQQSINVDMSQYPSGVYLLRATTDAGQATIKIVR